MTVSKIQYKQRGLAVVEFAIALPLIILMALAVTELGRGMYQYNTLSKAVHDGARYLSDNAVNTVGEIDIDLALETATQRVVVYGSVNINGNKVLDDLSEGDVDVLPVWIDLSDGDVDDNHVQVSADFTYDPLFDALSALGYSLIPSIRVTAVERALKI